MLQGFGMKSKNMIKFPLSVYAKKKLKKTFLTYTNNLGIAALEVN